MTCADYQSALVERARGELHDPGSDHALDAHLRQCGRCAARLASERRLTTALRALAESTAGLAVPEAMERSLVAAFEEQHASAAVHSPGARWSWRGLAAVAAMLFLTIAGATLAWRAADPSGGRAGLAQRPSTPGGPSDSAFVPWPGAGALPAFESGQLVRTELPASVLPLLGIRSARLNPGNTVMADVLVGQDGLARAVRLAN